MCNTRQQLLLTPDTSENIADSCWQSRVPLVTQLVSARYVDWESWLPCVSLCWESQLPCPTNPCSVYTVVALNASCALQWSSGGGPADTLVSRNLDGRCGGAPRHGTSWRSPHCSLVLLASNFETAFTIFCTWASENACSLLWCVLDGWCWWWHPALLCYQFMWTYGVVDVLFLRVCGGWGWLLVSWYRELRFLLPCLKIWPPW